MPGTGVADPDTVDPGTVDPGTVDPGTVDPGTVGPGAVTGSCALAVATPGAGAGTMACAAGAEIDWPPPPHAEAAMQEVSARKRLVAFNIPGHTNSTLGVRKNSQASYLYKRSGQPSVRRKFDSSDF